MSSSEPKIDRYLWVPDPVVTQIPPGEIVAERYQVVASQIWRDTLPAQLPDIPEHLLPQVSPYLRLFPYRLHVPEVYGSVRLGQDSEARDVILLENVPIAPSGDLYPAITEAWESATDVRQVYWLWQMLELWLPLSEQSVASSLLEAENIRTQGWRVWLRELKVEPAEHPEPSLAELAQTWMAWMPQSHAIVRERMQEICQQMQVKSAEVAAIAPALNQLLLELAAQQPLTIQISGASDTGPKRSHNEDSCYPMTVFPPDMTLPDDDIIPELAIVCDGIGGHEGGEVASQLAVRSLKLQIQGLLIELAEQTELVMPQVWCEHLESVVRVVNNLIAAQNDAQGRELRQRMGTTLVMTLQLPQTVTTTPEGEPTAANSHELYLAHVGDSRAYWITPHYCQQLTVDDDVSVREVRMGRSAYREALRRPDAGALTQALGTRDAEYVRPTVQRFIIEEDGILLLCSDGLSDRDRVETHWDEYALEIFEGRMTLDAAVQAWIDLANELNGHDNTSVVLLYCRVSPEVPALLSGPLSLGDRDDTPVLARAGTVNAALSSDREAEFFLQQTTTDPALQSSEPITTAASTKSPTSPRSRQAVKGAIAILGLLFVLALGGTVGLITWWRFDPEGVLDLQQRVLQIWQKPQTPTPN